MSLVFSRICFSTVQRPKNTLPRSYYILSLPETWYKSLRKNMLWIRKPWNYMFWGSQFKVVSIPSLKICYNEFFLKTLLWKAHVICQHLAMLQASRVHHAPTE